MRTMQRVLPAVPAAGPGARRRDMRMPEIAIVAVVSSVTADGEPATAVVESRTPAARHPVSTPRRWRAAPNGGLGGGIEIATFTR